MKKYVSLEFINKLETRSGRKEYNYLNSEDIKVEIGDVVLVDTVLGYSLGQVTGFTDYSEVEPSKTVLDVLTNKSEPLKALSLEVKRKELKKKMDEAMKNADEQLKLQMYADMDPKFAEMLEAYNKLGE